MSLVIGDNFSYGGTKPLDARLKYATVADMKAVAESTLYDGCFAYVTGTKKYYTFDSSNTVSEDTGKWREYASGGGGVTVDDEISHESENPVQNKVIADALDEKADVTDGNETISFADYNALSEEEKNNGKAYFIPDADIVTNFTVMGNRFDKANIYTAEERMVGAWMGKPLYQKTFVVDGSLEFTANSWLSTSIVIDDGEAIIDAELVDRPPNGMARAQIWGVLNSSTNVVSLLMSRSNNYPHGAYVTLRYTKTNDATVNIGTGNDYSTDEQVIGTWIDGKKLYQKTIACGAMPNKTTKNVPHNITNLDTVINMEGAMVRKTVQPYAVHSMFMTNIVTKIVGSNVVLDSSNTPTPSNFSDFVGYVTIQYTKTED